MSRNEQQAMWFRDQRNATIAFEIDDLVRWYGYNEWTQYPSGEQK